MTYISTYNKSPKGNKMLNLKFKKYYTTLVPDFIFTLQNSYNEVILCLIIN